MDNIDILNLKRKVAELHKQHNNLTALCKVLFYNVRQLRQELVATQASSNSSTQQSVPQQQQFQQQRMPQQQFQQQRMPQQNMNQSVSDLRADEILSQLSANVRN